MKYATGKDDPALYQTTWTLPCEAMDDLEDMLRYGVGFDARLRSAAAIIAAYRWLICASTTAEQTKNLAALRRVYRRKP